MPDGGNRAPRWLRSVWRRPVAFVTLLLISAIAVAMSILTPMLLRAVQEASLGDGVARASVGDRSVVVQAQATPGTHLALALAATARIGYQLENPLWNRPVQAVAAANPVPWLAAARSSRAESGLVTVAPDDDCASFTVVQGRCPRTALEVLVPASTQRTLTVPLGSGLALNPAIRSERVDLKVVGVYDDAHGYGAVLAAPDALAGAPVSEPSAALVIGYQKVDALRLDLVSYLTLTVAQPLRIDSVPDIEQNIQSAQALAQQGNGAQTSATVQSGLPALLEQLQAQNAGAAVICTAIGLEALALAWFALSAMIGRVSRVRAVEWGIGRTRGIVLGDWLSTVFTEPLVAVIVGGLLGLPAGYLAAGLVSRTALGSTIPIEPLQPPVIAAAALAITGSLVALVFASVRSARLPLPSLLRETTEPRRLSRLALVAQVGVVLVTAVVLWAVATQSSISGSQIALLAPSLIALTLGIVALRVAVLVVRGATSRPPRSVAGLVVGRQLARAPSALGGAVMVAVGLALATYVVSLFAIAARLEDDRAATDIGAATVLQVSEPAGRSLLTDVRNADPSGRSAMAARELTGIGATGTSRIVAVDSGRLAAVTTWLPAWRGPDPATLARRLDPPSSPALTFTGTRLQIEVTGEKSPQPAISDPDVRLQATFDTGDGWRTVDFGLLRSGTLTSPAGQVPCSAGCRLIDLTVEDPNATTTGPFAVGFTIAGISTDRQPAGDFRSWLTAADRWRQRLVDQTDPSIPVEVDLAASSAGLKVTMVANNGGIAGTLEPAVGPETLPVVQAARTSAEPFPGVDGGEFGTDFNEVPLVLSVVGTAPVIPRAGDSGVLVDLSQIERVSDTASAPAIDEVWLTPGDHSRILAALRTDGMRVLRTQTLAATIAEDREDAPVRSLEVMIATAAGALILTLLALVGARLVGGEARRRDLTTLRAAGLSTGRLARLSAVDFALPTAGGIVLGVLAGLGGFAVTVERLPLLAGAGGAPPPDYTPPLVGLALLVAGGVVVALIAAAGVAAVESRRSAE